LKLLSHNRSGFFSSSQPEGEECLLAQGSAHVPADIPDRARARGLQALVVFVPTGHAQTDQEHPQNESGLPQFKPRAQSLKPTQAENGIGRDMCAFAQKRVEKIQMAS